MWTAGAEALATAPFYEDAAAGRVGSLAAAQQLANRLREIGRQASGLEKSDQRVETYGRVIASCAHCHSITGDG
jgi:mono/diheme cytochrome c family protein